MTDLVEPDDREKKRAARDAHRSAWAPGMSVEEVRRYGESMFEAGVEWQAGAVAGTERERAPEAEARRQQERAAAAENRVGVLEKKRAKSAEQLEKRERALTQALAEAVIPLEVLHALERRGEGGWILRPLSRAWRRLVSEELRDQIERSLLVARAALPVPDTRLDDEEGGERGREFNPPVAPTPRAYPARGERWRHHSTGVYEVVCVRRDGLYAVEEEGGAWHFLRIDYFLDNFTPVPDEGAEPGLWSGKVHRHFPSAQAAEPVHGEGEADR